MQILRQQVELPAEHRVIPLADIQEATPEELQAAAHLPAVLQESPHHLKEKLITIKGFMALFLHMLILLMLWLLIMVLMVYQAVSELHWVLVARY